MNTINVYNMEHDVIYDGGLILSKDELDNIIDAMTHKKRLYKYGIKIEGTKYVAVRRERISKKCLYIHCKYRDEGVLCIQKEDTLIIVKYEGEVIPAQFEKIIEKVIDYTCK